MALSYSFPDLEPVCCSISSSNCCFLTYIKISQKVGQVVWCSHLFQNFPQFVVIHKVKGFGVINKAEVDVFLELSCFFYDPTATAAAKSLQSCPTLCNPTPGTLQARALEWVAIAFSRYADDTTLMAESKEELKCLLMKVERGK